MIRQRIVHCVRAALPVAWKTSLWFLKIMLPVSFLVMLLSYWNVLPYLSSFAAPLFMRLGLPGDGALVFVTSIFTNIYTVIALMANMDFSVREGVILATMCLISHNYLIETLVQKKTGSSVGSIIILRFLTSFVAAFLLNRILPDLPGRLAVHPVAAPDWTGTFLQWFQNSLLLSVRVVVIISLLMILQRILEEFGVLKRLSFYLAPVMVGMGLPRQTAFLWLVGNTLGLAYGAAVMMDYAESGKLSRKEGNMLNYHLAVSHSQLEDPLLFSVMGLPVAWLVLPRLILAIGIVWLKRFYEMVIHRHAVIEISK